MTGAPGHQAAAPGVEGTVLNIAHHLPRQARERPFQRAVVVPRGRGRDGRVAYAHATFAQLDALCDRYAHALAARGLARGERTLILVRPGIELIALMYAVFKVGAVPVFIDPGMGLRQLVASAARVAPRAFIGVAAAQTALAIAGRRALATVEHRLLVGAGWGAGAVPLDRLAEAAPDTPFTPAPTRADETAAILFTSGSTGPAKGVVYEHGMFEAQVRMLREAYGIEPGEVDLPGLPVFALFSVALGATTVLPDLDPVRPAGVDPAAFVRAIEDHGVTYSFGSPAIWKPVTAWCVERGVRLPSLRRVLMAGAPVPPLLHERLRRILADGADSHTPYGATEALPVANATGRELAETAEATRAGAGTCVGRALPGVELRVIAITDEPLADWSEARELGPGERGEVVVAGPSVTKAYAELEEATRAAKLRGPDGRTWHRMGDLGYLDEQGRLWFCGRKAHRVEAAAGTLFSVCCEAVFDQHPGVARAALVGVGPRGQQRPVIVVEPRPGAWPRGAAAREALFAELRALGAAHPHTAAIETFLVHRAFPVDVRHNAKIRREELAVWAAKQLA